MPNTPRTSYAEVVDRAIRAIRTRCLDYSLSDIEALCPSCAADIAALRELATIAERAERNEAEHIPVANRGDSVEVVRHVRDGREIIADLAAGFDPAEAERT